MRWFGIFALIGLLIIVPTANPVSAGKGWCRSDPIVSLNGVELQFWVAIPLESQAQVAGPISITLVAPRSTKMHLIYTDSGFNGYGESVNLAANGTKIAADGTFIVKAIVSVPMIGNQFIPMQVEVVSDSGGSVFVEGETVGVTLTLTLKGETIADILAHGGVVLPAIPSVTDPLPTSPLSPSATPTPIAIAIEAPTKAPTTSPTGERTTEPTATVAPTEVAMEDATVEMNATDANDQTSDHDNATGGTDEITQPATLSDGTPFTEPTEEGDTRSVESPTEATAERDDAGVASDEPTAIMEAGDEPIDGNATTGDDAIGLTEDDEPTGEAVAETPISDPTVDATSDDAAIDNDDGLSEVTPEAPAIESVDSSIAEAFVTEEFVEYVEIDVIVGTLANNGKAGDDQQSVDETPTPTPTVTLSPTVTPSPSPSPSASDDHDEEKA